MKILKVKVKRSKNPEGGTHYTYPPEYDARKIQVLCYESIGDPTTVNDRDKTAEPYEFLIGVVNDGDASSFLESSDIEEIDQTTANSSGRLWRPQVVRIDNQERVLEIADKVFNNISLTQLDKSALNPDSSEPGISRSKLFDNLLAEHL